MKIPTISRQNTLNLVILCYFCAEDGKEMIYNARAQLLFCSLNLLFRDVLVADAFVVYLSSLIA